MLYLNYKSLSKEQKRIKHIVLSELYPLMYNFMVSKRRSADWKDVSKKYMQYESALRNDFLQDVGFVPRQKVEWSLRIISARCPMLFDWIYKRLTARSKCK